MTTTILAGQLERLRDLINDVLGEHSQQEDPHSREARDALSELVTGLRQSIQAGTITVDFASQVDRAAYELRDAAVRGQRSDSAVQSLMDRIQDLRRRSLYEAAPNKAEPLVENGKKTPSDPEYVALDADLVAALIGGLLVSRHDFANGEIGDYDPVPYVDAVTVLAEHSKREPDKIKGFATEFFDSHFRQGSSLKPYQAYEAACRDKKKLLGFFFRWTGTGKSFAIGTIGDES